MEKYVVWQNYDIDINDYREEAEERLGRAATDEEIFDCAYEYINDSFEDEKANLSFTAIPNTLVVIANLGLWDGCHKAWTSLGRNCTLSDCLNVGSDCEYASFCVNENDDFVSQQSHHDGTNNLIYRSIETETLEEMEEYGVSIDELLEKSAPIGNLVKKVYGWE